MKKWINAVFGGDEEQPVRELNHARDLQVGDIVKFRYLPQSDLSNQQFEVNSINTYDFEDRNLTEFVLKGNQPELIFMTVDETGDEPFLALSKKISRDVVEKLFNLDEFALLFDDESNNTLQPISEPESLEGWTGKAYIQEIFSEGGYFFKGDYRSQSIPQNENEGDRFDYYLAIDNTREFVVEAEVYDGGETDVLITVRRPLRDIEELWPKANG